MGILSGLVIFSDNSDIAISTVFIFSMEIFSFYRFLDIHEINQCPRFIAGLQNVCMHTVLFTIDFFRINNANLLCFGCSVENFVIIKKVLLEFRNLWRWYFTCSIVTVNVVEIEKLLREPFRIVVELASLC